MGRKLTQEQKTECIELYKNGMTGTQLGKKYSVNSSTIYDLLHRCNEKVRDCTILTKEQDIECVKLYQSGMVGSEVGKHFNIDVSTVYKILERNGCKRREMSEVIRKYECNEHFFDGMNKEEQIYYFGLLFADGSIDTRKNVIALGLQERDKHIIQSLTNLVQPDKPVMVTVYRDKHPNWQDIHRMVINSRYMTEVLFNYGLVPNKSMIKEFPQVILNSGEDALRHFIRGYFDGNGTIRWEARKHSGSLSITSTLNMCENIKDIIYKYLNISMDIL